MSTRNFSIAAMSSYSAPRASYANKSLVLADSCAGVTFGKSGYRAYVMELSTQQIRQYNLAAPWDISSSVGSSAITPPSAGSGRGVFVHPEGIALIRYNYLRARLESYSMATPWEIASFGGFVAGVNFIQDNQPMDFSFNLTGTNLYMLGFQNKRVYQYSLSPAYNITTLVYTGKSLDVSGQDGLPYSMEFNPTGTVLYVAGDNDIIYQYTLTTPWDLATASYSGSSFSVAAQCTAVTGIAFKPDGLGFVLQGPAPSISSQLLQYNLT